jgi:hypothetical protein
MHEDTRSSANRNYYFENSPGFLPAASLFARTFLPRLGFEQLHNYEHPFNPSFERNGVAPLVSSTPAPQETHRHGRAVNVA